MTTNCSVNGELTQALPQVAQPDLGGKARSGGQYLPTGSGSSGSNAGGDEEMVAARQSFILLSVPEVKTSCGKDWGGAGRCEEPS